MSLSPEVIRRHRAWREKRTGKPGPAEVSHFYIRHGAWPDVGEHAYAARIHAPEQYVSRVLRHAIETGISRQDGVVEKAASGLPDGGRWITIHPNGPEAEGAPVYIVDNPDGTATIVAGAGGKLNGLRMGLVSSEEQYRKDTLDKSRSERQAAKAQADALRQKLGEEEYKRQVEEHQAGVQADKNRRLEAKKQFAATVLAAQGIDPESVLNIPDSVLEGLKSDTARRRLEEAHINGVVKHARKVADGVRRDVALAIAAHAPVAGVSFEDLAREVLSGNGVGYNLSPEAINVARGVVPSREESEEIARESAILRAEGDTEEAARQMASTARLQAGAQAARAQIKEALRHVAEGGVGHEAIAALGPKPIPLEQAGAILAAARQLREADQPSTSQVRRAYSPVSFTPAEDGDPASGDVAQLARTMAVSQLVRGVNDLEEAGNSLHAHISGARFLAMTEAGAAIVPGFRIDPALCDFLGSEGAARVVVETVRQHAGDEGVERLAKAISGRHLREQERAATEAVKSAMPLLERANAPLEVDPDDPDGLIVAQAALAQKAEYAGQARKVLGQARGRLEAMASLVWATGRPAGEPINVVMPGDRNRVLAASYAVLEGLENKVDYDIVSPASGTMTLTVHPGAVGKLSQRPSVDRADRLSAAFAAAAIEGPGDPPPGMRREIDAMHPLMEIARREYGNIGPASHAAIRGYWLHHQGIDAASEADPAGPLTAAQEPVWREWQHHLATGDGMGAVQAKIADRFPVLGSVDLDDDDQVLQVAHRLADALGYDGVETSEGSTFYPALQSGKRSARAREAKGRLSRLIRSLWSHSEGAPEFDPDDVPSVSQKWSRFVRAQRGDRKAVALVQSVMQDDPSLQGGEGKPLRMTEGQQRMLHLIRANRRMAAGLGPGAGKTNVIFGSFLQARADGAASRGIVAVPSAVQGQMGAEWDRFVDPDAGVSVHANPKADRAERSAALAGGHDLVVMTHEGLRDEAVRAVASHLSTTPEDAAQRLREAPRDVATKMVHAATSAAGWDHDYVAYDEGHKALDRAGKEDSLLSVVLDAIATRPGENGRLPMYVFATGDPIKNDASEAWSLLEKVAPHEYTPDKRDRFLRSYGRGTEDAAVALRQEMQPYLYTQPAALDVSVNQRHHMVPMDEHERVKHDEIMSAYTKATLARRQGTPDAEAERVLGTSDPKAFALARDQRIANLLLCQPGGSRVRALREMVSSDPGRATVVFARNRASVDVLKAGLEADGHVVDTITGSDSAASKGRKRDRFQAGGVGVLICTDAAEAGMNLQRGSRIVNYDVPMTAKTREQRVARVARMGQTQDVDAVDMSSDSAWDARNRDRLRGKGALREIMTSPFELADDSGVLEYNLRRKAGV